MFVSALVFSSNLSIQSIYCVSSGSELLNNLSCLIIFGTPELDESFETEIENGFFFHKNS
jgi:hypothetical protein